MKQGLKILIVDDEQSIRRYLRVALKAEGHDIFETATGEEALSTIISFKPDIVILDLGLPDITGIEVVKRLREWSSIPVIILSVQDRDIDKIAALDAGADDYVTKPFSAGELLARIRVAMRHTITPAEEPVFETGGLLIDLAHRIVRVDGEEIQLTPTEYDLLKLLVIHAGKVLTHNQLLREVWGIHNLNEIHLVRVHISNLRSKIEGDSVQPRYILTEPGVGYRLKIYD